MGGSEATAGNDLSLERLRTLWRVSLSIGQVTDLQALLNEIVTSAVACIGAERGLLILVDESGDEGRTVAAGTMEGENISFSRGIVRSTMEQRKTLVSSDLRSDPRFSKMESIDALNILSFVCTPLTVPGRGRPLGTLYVDQRIHVRTFTREDAAFLEAFANLAAIAINNASHVEELVHENLELRQESGRRYDFPGIVGQSRAMQKVFYDMTQVLDDDCTVLVTGPSGSGKELIARAIHENGSRKSRPFLAINCGALPETLLEAELFGSRRGAFTGAIDRQGVFEAAHGGTVFLDEVQHTSQAMQIKLLRFMQAKEVRRVGDTAVRNVDVRLICATNEDMRKAVSDGRVRPDFYYRINVVTISVPPLAERREDIALLARHFLGKYARAKNKRLRSIEPGALRALTCCNWTENNVRQLANEIERAVIFAGDRESLELKDLSGDVRAASETGGSELMVDQTGRPLGYHEFQRRYIEHMLAKAHGNKAEAARMMGIHRSTLLGKLRKYGLAGK